MAHAMACPRSFYVYSGRSGGVRALRTAMEAHISDRVGLFGGGSAPKGPGDHSPRLPAVGLEFGHISSCGGVAHCFEPRV